MHRPSSAQWYHVRLGIVEVEEQRRVLVLFSDVVPDRETCRDTATVCTEVGQAALGASQQLCLLQHPAGFHTLALTVQHESAEPVGQLVIGQELKVVLVELKRHGKLRVNLQRTANKPTR